jgi:hypothetical protein
MHNFDKSFKYLFTLLVLFLIFGCGAAFAADRADFVDSFPRLCKTKFQAYVTCKEAGDTVWVYLPRAASRQGSSGTKEEESDLYLQYEIASFNPYRIIDPPELKFVVQKMLGQMRNLLLHMSNPYKYFVLVVTDITINDPKMAYEDWYIGNIEDVKNHSVGADFSGEGYSRLVFSHEKINKVNTASDGKETAASYRDTTGEHIEYHDMALREFVVKQIEWRIYKRFTIEYNKTPFDLTAEEKESEVLKIIKTVVQAYNFKEFEKVYIADKSFLEEQSRYKGFSLKDLQRYRTDGITRRPAF